ncbi:MAG: outer membrane protein assembly factor BamD [Paracoccaceae bacterium]
MTMPSFLRVMTVMLLTCLAACGNGDRKWWEGDRKIPIEERTAEEIYQIAETQMAEDDFDKAAKTFSEIERLYPYSEWAERALLMQAFAAHQDKDYDTSRGAAQRYLDFYPASESAAYAQYLVALSYYDQIDDVGRDQAVTVEALEALTLTFERYGDSEYTQPARMKFDLAFDHLASKEMEVGRYYLDEEHYTAAISRFRIVIEKFQTTTHSAEALYRLVESYLALGFDQEAQTAAAILGFNYQNTDWYAQAFDLLRGQGLEAKMRGDNWLARFHRESLKGQWR